ncbi:lysozyme 1-like [Branchiostoma floridae]|uniref:lysozyme n=1 Tax=Branchiostoma floridae TaxID=7739 RepID=A0A9J7MTV4_BRAFL|nr:lysozyme 1-like [Branchiostoma floridae]
MSKAPVILLASLIGCLSVVHAGYVPDACINCICYVESGCRMPDPICHMDTKSLLCGPFRLRHSHWLDSLQKGGPLMNDYQRCAASWACSRQALDAYLQLYAVSSRLGHSPTCQDFARIHHEGPNGFKSAATIEYWEKVKKCLERGPTL